MFNLTALLVVLTLLACTPQSKSVRDTDEPPTEHGTSLTPQLSADQQRLQNYLRQHPHQRGLLVDVAMLLEAEQAHAAGKHSAALAQLQHTFLITHGAMQDHVFGRYLQVLADMQARPQPLNFYLQHVHTQLGYEHETLAAELTAKLRGRLALAADDFQPPIDLASMLQDDPTLEVHARRYCQPHAVSKKWQAFITSLDKLIKAYWQGLTSACAGETQAALANFETYLQQEDATQARPMFVLTATAAWAKAGRRLVKSRAWVARAYAQLAEVWHRGDVTAADLNMTQAEFLLRRSSDLLWAARFLALQASYELAETQVQAVLQAVDESLQLPEVEQEQFAVLAAEAYHVLAFRIEVERQQYQRAIAHSNAALHYPLSAAWRERILWHKGLYHYLAEEWQAAASVWHAMLELPASRYEAQLLFWLAKVTQHLQDESESQEDSETFATQIKDYHQRLAANHPLSYYNLSLTTREPWYAQHDVAQWREMLATHAGIDVAAYRQHEVFGTTLQRAEILVDLRLLPLAQIELRELEHQLKEQDNLTAQGLRLYVSRLYAKAGNYLRSIIVTTRAARQAQSLWQQRPEQLLIYYPQPYLRIYQQEARSSGLEAELLLAISRQESAFNAAARGGVQEFGLMQLLPATAQRVAAANDIVITAPATQLLTPALNIKLGALYLRSVTARYRHSLAAGIAAYNAGEEAADAWTQRRAHPDPQVWIELIPFGSTRTYVKRVQRNLQVYQFLSL